MYVYDNKARVRKPDSEIAHILLNNPESETDKMTACGLIVWSDWRLTLRDVNCGKCYYGADLAIELAEK